MDRRSVPLLLGAVVLVAGCDGAGDGEGHSTGGEPDPAVVHSPGPRQTPSPWPAFTVDDYTYTLRVSCFCPDGGVPVVVAVRDGTAVSVVYAHRGRGHAAGENAGDWMQVSINDVIDAANTQHAYQVKVRWPEGQAYPSSVYVDRDANMADEEIGYSIRDVTPA